MPLLPSDHCRLGEGAALLPPLPDLRYITHYNSLKTLKLIATHYKLYRFFSAIFTWTEGRQRQDKGRTKTR
jgi:hypothetical protein